MPKKNRVENVPADERFHSIEEKIKLTMKKFSIQSQTHEFGSSTSLSFYSVAIEDATRLDRNAKDCMPPLVFIHPSENQPKHFACVISLKSVEKVLRP